MISVEYTPLQLEFARQRKDRLKRMNALPRLKAPSVERRSAPMPVPVQLPPPPTRVEIATPRSALIKILQAVCKAHQVSPKLVMSPVKSSDIVAARQELCYRLREERAMSWCEIGRFIKRDHTSALHAYRKHAAKLKLVKEGLTSRGQQ